MSDMTRHDIYGHEVAALAYYVEQMLNLPTEQRTTPYLEIIALIKKIKSTDAGPLPRGETITKEYMVDAVYRGLKACFYNAPHVEVKVVDKQIVQVFVRPRDRAIYDFVIKITKPTT